MNLISIRASEVLENLEKYRTKTGRPLGAPPQKIVLQPPVRHEAPSGRVPEQQPEAKEKEPIEPSAVATAAAAEAAAPPSTQRPRPSGSEPGASSVRRDSSRLTFSLHVNAHEGNAESEDRLPVSVTLGSTRQPRPSHGGQRAASSLSEAAAPAPRTEHASSRPRSGGDAAAVAATEDARRRDLEGALSVPEEDAAAAVMAAAAMKSEPEMLSGPLEAAVSVPEDTAVEAAAEAHNGNGQLLPAAEEPASVEILEEVKETKQSEQLLPTTSAVEEAIGLVGA